MPRTQVSSRDDFHHRCRAADPVLLFEAFGRPPPTLGADLSKQRENPRFDGFDRDTTNHRRPKPLAGFSNARVDVTLSVNVGIPVT